MEDEEARKDDAETLLEKTSKVVLDVKSGVEHLTEKLKVLKAVCTRVFASFSKCVTSKIDVRYITG